MSETLNNPIDIAKIQQGDLDEFERLYQKYVTPIYSYAFKVLQIEEESEEITQEVFIAVWQQKDLLQSENIVWTMARRKCIDYFRKRKHTFLPPSEWEFLFQVCSEEQKIIEEDERQYLIQKLTMEEREVIVLAIKGVSRNEIALMLDIPIGTVDSRLNRIKHKLKR